MVKKLDVSVIIPFKDHSDLTNACIESISKLNLREVLLISNNSSEAELHAVQQVANTYANTKVLIYNEKFNYQKINNWAAAQAVGKALWLLNNDVELPPDSEKLVEAMYTNALDKNTGAVGAVLTYGDKKTIQHAGVYLVPGGTADHLYIGKDLKKIENAVQQKKAQYDIVNNLDASAVTAASLMVERTKFEAIKGFNEDFIITGGDVDLCLRLSDKGYAARLVGSKFGTMIHKESQSRSHIGIPYNDFIQSYYSYIKHFDITTGDHFINPGTK